MISIIDYGMGNVGSLQNMIQRVGGNSELVNTPEAIEKANKLILPGVGAFDHAVQRLTELGIFDILNHVVSFEKKRILCICLGVQLATRSSEEGSLRGFGWIRAKTVKFKAVDSMMKIPHMGWNDINLKKESILFRNMHPEPCFYFVHSYFIECEDSEDILCTTNYRNDFVSAFEKGNIFGVQFHPEKSHKFGLLLIKNFVEA